jgi:hypothetical protein
LRAIGDGIGSTDRRAQAGDVWNNPPLFRST